MQRIFIICRFQCAPETRIWIFRRVSLGARLHGWTSPRQRRKRNRAPPLDPRTCVAEMCARPFHVPRPARKIRNYFPPNAGHSQRARGRAALPLSPAAALSAFISGRLRYTKCPSGQEEEEEEV